MNVCACGDSAAASAFTFRRTACATPSQRIWSGQALASSPYANYAESTFQLADGQQLTLVTDGVVEARDKSGALFGFERTASLSSQSAQAITQALRHSARKMTSRRSRWLSPECLGPPSSREVEFLAAVKQLASPLDSERVPARWQKGVGKSQMDSNSNVGYCS